MEYIYFGTTKGKLVDNYELAKMARVVDNMEISEEDFEAVREYAKSCRGITGEVKHPSIRFLLKNGEKVKAVQIYYRAHPELGMKGSKDAVEKIMTKMNLLSA